MCIISGKVCRLFPRNASLNQRTVNEMKTDNGETPKIRRIWKTVKGWFSMYEIKEPALHGGYLSRIYGQR